VSVQEKLKELGALGWDVLSLNFADIILASEFEAQTIHLLDSLMQAKFSVAESIIKSGGGLATQTQALASEFNKIGKKNIISVSRQIEFERDHAPISTEDSSHEIDHLAVNEIGQFLAIEIEWNNKDEFYDRDFQSLKRLYEMGVIEAGVIVTRGQSLEDRLFDMILKYFENFPIEQIEDFENMRQTFPNPKNADDFLFSFPTEKQKLAIRRKVEGSGKSVAESAAEVFKSSKFVGTTTNWRQLQKRVDRRDGGRTPILCLGIPNSVFDSQEASA